MLSLEQSMAANTSELDPVYAQFRDQTRFWIQRVAVPLLMVIGLFGNLITMIIMTRRGMRSTTNMYLAALAFVDMLYLVLTFLLGLSHYPNMAGYRYYIYWKLKPFLMMLTDACSNTSVWLTVTFTIERYIAVKYPMKGKVWCTEKRAKMLIVCVFMFGTLFALPVPFEWKVIEKKVPANMNQWPVAAINGPPSSAVASSLSASASSGASNAALPTTASHNVTINLSPKPQAPDGAHLNDLNLEGRMPTRRNDELAVNDSYILTLDFSDFGRNETYKTYYYRSIAFIFYFVPLFSLMLFNGFLIKSVHQSKRERTKMTRRTISGGHALKSPPSSQRPSKADITSLKKNNLSNSNSQLMESHLPANCEVAGTDDVSGHTSGSVRKYSLNRLNKLKSFLYPSRHKKNRAPSGQGCSTIQGGSLSYPAFIRQHNGAGSKAILDGQVRQGSTQTQPLLKDESVRSKLSTVAPVHISAGKIQPTSNATIELNEPILQSSACDSGPAAKRIESVKSANLGGELKRITANDTSIQQQEGQKQCEHADETSATSTADNVGADLAGTIKTIDDLPARLTLPKRSLAANAAGSSSQQMIVPASTQERRITIMLIAVVILFLFCQIPSAAMLLYTSVRDMAPNTNEHALVLAFGNIFNFLVAVNAAGNFILYSFLSKKYRRTFVILFCSCLGSRQKQQQQANRMLSVRFEASRMSQRNSSSIYQNSSRATDKSRTDTLV